MMVNVIPFSHIFCPNYRAFRAVFAGPEIVAEYSDGVAPYGLVFLGTKGPADSW
jgi:hypothetical protein